MSESADRPLRVGVNLLYLVPGVVGGTEEYATRLLDALLDARPDDIDVVVFARHAFAAAYPDIVRRCTVVSPPFEGGGRPARVLTESTWLALESRRRRVDLLHHVGGRLPLVSTVPGIVTIHDLQPLDHPENFSWIKRTFLGRALPRTARRAKAITTPSEFVRRGVISRLHARDDRVTAMAAPLPASAAAATDGSNAATDISSRPAMVGDAPYFLFPAITYAHKNHAVLLEAFAQLSVERPDVRLVLIGAAGPCEGAVRDQIARLGMSRSVLRTGRVPDDERDALVRHAVALVFPSRYEGFGLPVAEAMAVGCPVIVADATALPEVVGDAGVLVDPDDVDGWHKAMAEQLDADRAATGDRGRAILARYDGPATAARLIELYRRVASSGSA